jgi:hypothetical protein
VFVAVLVAWALMLLVTGVWYSFHGKPTIRDQTTIAQARPRVDDALAAVLRAAGTAPVVSLSEFAKTADCDVTPVRAGAKYQQSVRLYTPVGSEAALMGRIVHGLPAGYKASEGGTKTPTLAADAGFYIQLTGGVDQPGVLKIVAGTGCRPVGAPIEADPTGTPPAADRARIDPVLADLRAHDVKWSTHTLPCGVRTLEATATADVAGSLRTALHEAGALIIQDDVAAYQGGGTGLAVRRATGVVAGNSAPALTVTATTGSC